MKILCSLLLLPFLRVDDLFAGIAKLNVLLAKAGKDAAPAGRRSSAEFVVIAFASRPLFRSEVLGDGGRERNNHKCRDEQDRTHCEVLVAVNYERHEGVDASHTSDLPTQACACR
jgi:hypothetical protein